MSAAMKVLVNSIIVVEHILKFIEMVSKFENDFKISEFYRIQTFQKMKNNKIYFLKISYFLKNVSGRAPALRVSRAVTRLTVHRSLPSIWSSRRMMHHHPKMVKVLMFCLMILEKSHRIRCGTYHEDSQGGI